MSQPIYDTKQGLKFSWKLNLIQTIIFRWFSSFYWKFRSTDKYFWTSTGMWKIWSISWLLGGSVSKEKLKKFLIKKNIIFGYKEFSWDNRIMKFNHPSFSCCYWSLSGFKKAAWFDTFVTNRLSSIHKNIEFLSSSARRNNRPRQIYYTRRLPTTYHLFSSHLMRSFSPKSSFPAPTDIKTTTFINNHF